MAVTYFQRFDLFPPAKWPSSGFWDRDDSKANGVGALGISTSATVSDLNRILWLGAFGQDVDIAVKYRPLGNSILNSGNATADAGIQIYARATTEFTDPANAASTGLLSSQSISTQTSIRLRQRLTGTLSTLLNTSTTGNLSSADMNGPFGKWFRIKLNASNFQRANWLSSGSPSALSTAAAFTQNAAVDSGTYVGISWAAQGVCRVQEICVATGADVPVYTPPADTHLINGTLLNPSAALVGAGHFVDVCHRPTNKIFETTTTDSLGFWEVTIPEQFSADEFFAVARDSAGTWSHPIGDRIVPSAI